MCTRDLLEAKPNTSVKEDVLFKVKDLRQLVVLKQQCRRSMESNLKLSSFYALETDKRMPPKATCDMLAKLHAQLYSKNADMYLKTRHTIEAIEVRNSLDQVNAIDVSLCKSFLQAYHKRKDNRSILHARKKVQKFAETVMNCQSDVEMIENVMWMDGERTFGSFEGATNMQNCATNDISGENELIGKRYRAALPSAPDNNLHDDKEW